MKSGYKNRTRRSFLRHGMGLLALITLSGPARIFAGGKNKTTMKEGRIMKAAVVWFSQAGHTERNGKLIADTLKKEGLSVVLGDYRDFDRTKLATADLIIMGSPVYYYDVPRNFREWLGRIPGIEGVPVAAYVTFGGEGGNQHNAVCSLAELLQKKGGVLVAMDKFGNMSTYPPTWSMGYDKKVLAYRFLPDENTFAHVRSFAKLSLDNALGKKTISYEKELDFREAIKGTIAMWTGFKLFSGKYSVDKKTCIHCNKCVMKCPTGSIDIHSYSINKDTCIACMGCVNNCPVQAVNMTFMGKRLNGFFDFLKKNRIQIKEPV